jgi:hypothetical protein
MTYKIVKNFIQDKDIKDEKWKKVSKVPLFFRQHLLVIKKQGNPYKRQTEIHEDDLIKYHIP